MLSTDFSQVFRVVDGVVCAGCLRMASSPNCVRLCIHAQVSVKPGMQLCTAATLENHPGLCKLCMRNTITRFEGWRKTNTAQCLKKRYNGHALACGSELPPMTHHMCSLAVPGVWCILLVTHHNNTSHSNDTKQNQEHSLCRCQPEAPVTFFVYQTRKAHVQRSALELRTRL